MLAVASCFARPRAALADGNRRAAVIAFEQALLIADDADVRKQYADLRDALTRYDEQRSRAAQLRRNPQTLEDAIAALQEAQKAWDTNQVRMDLDEYTFALQKRRDRLSVADFEIRGDVGAADAGRTVAETLLPFFKSRFDLVEREQLNQLVTELKLEAGTLGDPSEGRQELGRLARIRYLVVGSVTPLEGGFNVNARLVEVQTGLIVQTARLSAPTLTALLDRLPALGQMLMMNDDQRAAFQQALAEKAAAVELKPIETAPLPPPPPPFDPDAPLPPSPPLMVTYSARAIAFGGLTIEEFRAFPPVVVVETPPPPIEVVVRRDDPRRRRMLQLTLELGDNLFRRGRCREAHRHYSLALNFCDDQADIQVRLDRCRPFLPPPAPVVILAPVVRPRLVVFNFLLNAQPGLVPAATGDWAADQLGGYFSATHEIVERGEVCWYMGRLGITMRDVLTDPSARLCLAQALNVRYFVFGAIVQTGSLDVSTHLIDAQSGSRTATAAIHVQDHEELKFRFSELLQQMGAPRDQARLAEKGRACEKALNEARNQQKAGMYAQAADAARAGLKIDPDNVALKTLLRHVEMEARQADMEAARQREAVRTQEALETARRKQAELVLLTRAARLQAEQEGKARTKAEREAEEARKQRAAEQFQAEGRRAMQKGDFGLAVQTLRSAVALKPSDEGFRELAQAEVKLEQEKRKAADAELLKRENAARLAREAAQARIELERKRQAVQETIRRQVQEDRDRAEYASLVDQARTLLKKGEYERAQNLALSAKMIRPGEEVNKLLNQVYQERELADARKKGEQASRDLARRLEEEKKRQEKADIEARKKEENYSSALKAGQAALKERKYDQAIGYFQDAGKLFKTDAVVSGLKTASELRDQAKAKADNEQRLKIEEEKRTTQLKKLLGDGARAMDVRDYEEAVKAYTEAVHLVPGNVDALAGKSKAQQARTEYLARNREEAEQKQNLAKLRDLVQSGKTALNAKRYDEAVSSLTEAARLSPKDTEVAALVKDAERRRDAVRADELALKKRQDEYQGLLKQGKAELAARRYTEAIKFLTDANKIIDEPIGRGLLQQAQQARTDGENTEKVRDLVLKARAAMKEKKFDDADLYLGAARKLNANDPTVATAQKDLDVARKPSPAEIAKLKQREADFKLAIDAGRDAYKKGNFVGAINAFKEAERLMPGDKDALDMLRGAERARDEAVKKNQVLYSQSITAAGTALKAKKFDDAIAAANQALKIQPGDKDAQTVLQQAQTGKAGAGAEIKKKEDFTRLMSQGQAAQAAKKYAEAISAYTEALRLFPMDADAKKGLADATALNKPLPPPPPNPQAEYARLMTQGTTLDQQKKYADAIKAYTDALKAIPNDAKASAGLKNASYNFQMAEGSKAAQAKKFPDAIKAYEEALKLKPSDPDATAALKRAKDGKP